MTKKLISVRNALREALEEEMELNDKVFVLGEEVAEYEGAYKVTGQLFKTYPNRVIDTPISEHGFTGIAIGAAFAGLKPIVEFMSFNFSMQAIDQIINSASKTSYMSGGKISCPIVFRGPNGAAARVAAQHSQCYASWYAHIPGLKVISPYFAYDCKGLLKSAIRDQNPVIFLENEIAYNHQHTIPEGFYDNYLTPIGKANIIKSGKDITILSFSIMVTKAIEAASILQDKYNIDAEIIDLRTIRPLDKTTILNSVKKCNRLLIAEEGWHYSGIGSEITAIVVEEIFDELDAPIGRVTAKDVPLPYAKNLEQEALPQTQDIVNCALKICEGNY